MALASIEHIDVDDKGVARIAGQRTKVIQVVMDKLAHNWSPEEIHVQYSHLSLAQIHAAFTYYYDNQDELDTQIAADVKRADELREQAGESPLVQKLRAMGKLP
jgi:uncharacterized protein (DUF433 family)